MKRIAVCLAFHLLFLIPSPVSYGAEEPKKIAIIPFVMHAERDLSFLRDGILDMLGSRLYREGRVEVIEKGLVGKAMGDYQGPITIAYASEVAGKVGSDYGIFGSLTMFGESVSLDATLVSITKNEPPTTVFFQTKDMESVIPEINTFAQKVAAQIFGETPPDKEFAPARQEPAPERLSNGPAPPPGPAPGKPGEQRAAFWKGQTFQVDIRGMALGDTDGDGRNELVFISGSAVFIYRYADGALTQFREVPGERHAHFIAVDVADINGNGKSEIFVTDLRKDVEGLTSFVLEWDGTTFRKIAENEKWYYRVLNVPGRETMLLGQKRGMHDVFGGDVYELQWSGDEYIPKERLGLPRGVNVYGFSFGDILHNGREMLVVLTGNDRLRIMSRDGNEEWTSTERYGGSDIRLDSPPEGGSMDTQEIREIGNIFYLPQRVHVADVDGDGRQEIIAVKNQDAAGRIFERFRSFKSGHIECLQWNELGGLDAAWTTDKVSGYISDYVVGDLNHDGRDDIVFSVVRKSAFTTGEEKSFIVAWYMSR